MKIFCKLLCIIIVVTTCFSLVGCGEKSNDATVYFELLEKPRTLDPQTASSDSELVIVRNLFEGLLRKDKSGKITEGACESYKKSGNTYTFKLREDLKWSNGKKMTADDFVFGLRRAVLPETQTPDASKFFSITNAESINSGGMDASMLGVKASGRNVIITLDYDDPDFLETLTSAAAMPCNQKYFEKAGGRYCLDAKNVLCNGSYDIFRWTVDTDSFGIKLYRNDYYGGIYKAVNGGVYFSCVEDEKQSTRLLDNASDVAFLPSAEIDDISGDTVKVASVENICWVLTLGNEYNENVRRAFLMAFSGDIYGKSLPKGYRIADSFFPGVLEITGASSMGGIEYNIDYANSLLSSEVKKAKEEYFGAATLYYYADEGIKDAVTDTVAHWQQNLCAFVNVTQSESLTALSKELTEKSLQFAVFPIKVRSKSLADYLKNFNVSGDAASAQNALLSSNGIVPFAFQNTNVAYNTALSNVRVDDGNGYIDFAYIYKDED